MQLSTTASRFGAAGGLLLLTVGTSPNLLAKSVNQNIDQQATYEALVQRTEGGIPNISAHDFASLGFGTGYAMAEDLICLLADERFLTFSAQRSRFLGEGDGNLESDFFYQLFIDRGEAEEPVDPRQAALFRGAAAGYNRYLRDTDVDNLPDESCRGQEWVREIGEIDWRRVSRMNFLLPFVSGLITAAQPPSQEVAIRTAPDAPAVSTKQSATPQALTTKQQAEIQVAWNDFMKPYKRAGSNGIGLGYKATVGGKGMLATNPHQGWNGVDRFYAFHQILPGELNISGANVIGRPQVAFGTTADVAWTSTVSTASRNTFYQLILNPANPTQYMFDNEIMDMIQETVTVQVPDGNGGFEDRTHTFYSTHFGAFLVGGFFPWNNFVAFAVRPALSEWRDIDSLVAQYQSKSVRELKAVHDAGQFLPVNLVAADSSGEALYADPGPIPHLTDFQMENCTPFGSVLGNISFCQWGTDADAVAPGIWGPSNLPSLFRKDYVSNSNDTFWLANPAEPLTGFQSNLGVPGAEQTLRTRSTNAMVEQRLNGTDGLPDTKFTLKQLQTIMLSNQNYTAQILRDDVVTLCEANPSVTLPDGTIVDISEACPVLAAWDLHDNLDSRGAHVFREMIAEAGGRSSRRLPEDFNYKVPFDAANPLTTPRGLDTDDNPVVLEALARSVQKLDDAGVALDARLGDLQYVVRNGELIPMHGGPESQGVFNKVTANFDAAAGGYPEPSSGSSWIQATEFTDNGPVSRGILVYSQSPNPASPYYADQTMKFSQKEWVDLPFTEDEVAAAAESTLNLSEGKDDCKGSGWQAFTNPTFANQGDCVVYYNALRQQRLKEIKARY
jgi:acyl-homoserine-lactone acylase